MQKAAGSSPVIRSKFSMNGAGLRSRESTRLGIANIVTQRTRDRESHEHAGVAQLA